MSLRLLAIAALLPLAACGGDTTSMQFYPLEGEIAQSDPTLVIEGTASNVKGTSGPLTFRLPDRGRCEGTWSSLTPKTVSRTQELTLTWKKTGGGLGAESETVAGVLPLAACGGDTTSMQFYPLEGEIARTDPTLVIEGTASNDKGTSGPLTFRLPDRDRCEGTWSSLTPKTVSQTQELTLTWKKTGGGLGAESETVAGVNDGEIYAVCEDGTRVQGTFIIGSGTASGTVRATDTNGNVYKLLF